jgi:hypothetical protein
MIKNNGEMQADVFVTNILGKEEWKSKKIRVKKFVTEPAQIHVQKGETIPVEPYRSIRIDIGITCPCYVEEVKEVYKDITVVVNTLFEKEKKEQLKFYNKE